MKKAPIWGLVWKEFYCIKKDLQMLFWFWFGYSAIMMLVMGSFQYGNLRFVDEEAMESLYPLVIFFVNFIPLLGFSAIASAVSEYTIREEKLLVRRFYLVTPVSGFRIAGAKILSMAILFVFGQLCTGVYIFLLKNVFHSFAGAGIVGISLVIAAAVSLLSLVFLVIGFFTKSKEQAGLILIILMALVFIVNVGMGKVIPDLSVNIEGYLTRFGENPLGTMVSLEKLGNRLLPFAIAVCILIYLAGFGVLGLLYQRREK